MADHGARQSRRDLCRGSEKLASARRGSSGGSNDHAARRTVQAAIDRRYRRVGQADARARIIASLERLGFPGAIYPVNPNYTAVLNRACYPSLADLPEAPDVAVFCLGHERVLDAFIAGAKRGMKAAVIYDGGFAEQGAEGGALQARIEGICRDAGIALCGPNCMGVLNPHHRSTTYLQELRDPAGLAGNVGIVSHSGGLCVGLVTDTRRYGFSHIVSSGNEAVVTPPNTSNTWSTILTPRPSAGSSKP